LIHKAFKKIYHAVSVYKVSFIQSYKLTTPTKGNATMKRIIKNGVTIIKTGDANGGVKNKHNQTGVSQQVFPDGAVRYRAEMQVMGKKHYFGIRDTVEEAIELRLEAERQLANGTFDEWLKHIKKPKCRNRYNKKGIAQLKTSTGIRYRVDITVDGKRYYIAKRNNLQEAYDILEEAEQQVANGCFKEWLQKLHASSEIRPNKFGHAGIVFKEKDNVYCAKINHKKKYYHLGCFKNVEDAIELRKEADKHVKQGDFEEWVQELKHNKSKKGMDQE